jgi:hypothetical protein
MTTAGNQQVDWWCVHIYVERILGAVGADLPTAGTPEWCHLPDDDPRKLAALLWTARDWAFRWELNAEATIRAEASRAISAAADWSSIALEYRRRAELFAERPWLRRNSA